MIWVAPSALLALVAILVLPSRGLRRTGVLTRNGRLGPGIAALGAEQLGVPAVGVGVGVGRAGSMRDDAAGQKRTWPPARSGALAGGGLCLALAVTDGPASGFEAAVVLAVAAVLSADARRARAVNRRLAEFRSTVGLLAAELEAGTPPAQALAAAAEHSPVLRPELLPAAAAAGGGGTAVDALAASHDPQLRRLGAVWRVGESAGVPLVGVLGRLGTDLASAAEQRRAVAVTLAGPRSSAVLLCLLPVLGIGLGAAMGARPLPLLFATPAGQLLCCVGLLLDAAGVLWVRRILRRAESA